ncbi:MAG: hypothetical protein ACOXZU_09310 [Bacteroidales bacterium]|jgi:hypothetical protein
MEDGLYENGTFSFFNDFCITPVLYKGINKRLIWQQKSFIWSDLLSGHKFLIEASSDREGRRNGNYYDLVEELETIVVPAQVEGFQSAFIESNA